ncbi:anti-sigma factor antagonist [Bacteroidetes/Chlorobi group bacterium ChocPot_Mid]|jgi:anti-sigma B factor antagonist|nr:MAG: anti-sigma factor antagonist [Bacteroidetes/Chlorobi group bacterium ChocPot_Mid]
MNFSIENNNGYVIFTLKSKNLDSENSPQLKAELLILCQPTIKGLILDISAVEYIDSSGLGALLLAHRQLKENDTIITLVGAQDVVKSMLNISQLTDLFNLEDTVEEAIKSYN